MQRRRSREQRRHNSTGILDKTFNVYYNQQQFTFSVFARLSSPEPQPSQGKRIYPTSVHQVSLQMPQRKEEDGHWSQSRDEHTIQVLVFLLEGKFQQENVLGVQEACMGRCFIRLQVIVGSLSNSNMFQILSQFFTDMGWSVSSDSTVMDWKRNSDQIFTETSKQKH